MDNKKIKEISEILGFVEDDEFKEYFKSFNSEKFLSTYEKIRRKTDIMTAINLLNVISKDLHFEITDEVVEGLLLDDDLRDYALDNGDSKNKILIKINELLSKEEKEEPEDENEEDEEVLRELKESENFDGLPLYTEEEEKLAFEKYDLLKKKLETYIFAKKDLPEFEQFIDYINNLKIETRRGKNTKAQTKDSFIVKAITQLYRNTDNPVIVNIKKDGNILDMIEDLKEVRDDISLHNERLANSIAKKYLYQGVPREDLEQEAKIGLIKAINKFEVSRGNKFSTFAIHWIRQSVTRCIENESTTIRIPTHVYNSATKIRRAIKKVREEDLIDEPNEEEIFKKCQQLGYKVTFEQVKAYKKVELISTPVSTDKYVGEDEDTSLIEFLTSDNVEKPEDYAERMEEEAIINKILDNYSNGKYADKKDKIKPRLLFKQLTFVTKSKEVIKIILTDKEYNSFTDKKLSREEKRNNFINIIKLFKLDSVSLLPSLTVSDIKMTLYEREALIYRYRTCNNNEESEKFLKRRNYNNAFFDMSDPDEKITLEKVGKLFDVTRERIRQIQSKIDRKIDIIAGNVTVKSTQFLDLYIGCKENIYDILRISPSNLEYIVIIKPNPNPVATVDDMGNIITLGETGKVHIFLKNVISGISRELVLCVHPSLEDTLANVDTTKPIGPILKYVPINEEKDNQ